MKLVLPEYYIQEENVRFQLANYIKVNQVGILVDPFLTEQITKECREIFKNTNIKYSIVSFEGVVCFKNIMDYCDFFQSSKVIVGIGGGRVLDACKLIANQLNIECIIMPSIASSDAPISRLSVVYHEDGTFSHYQYFNHHPSLVLVDTRLIFNAPIHLMKAGMADALATYQEMKHAKNKPFMLVELLAKMCEEIILEKGKKAIEDCQKGILSDEFDQCIQAIILLSGVAFENGGLYIAHDFYNYISKKGLTNGFMHGQIVALGLIIQCDFLGEDTCKYKEFLKALHLPHTIEMLGLTKDDVKEFYYGMENQIF